MFNAKLFLVNAWSHINHGGFTVCYVLQRTFFAYTKKKKTWENGCELLLFETIELYKLALHYICTQAVSL